MKLTRTWRLLVRPTQEWHAISQANTSTRSRLLMYLLILAATAPLSLYFGTTVVGWSLPGSKDVTYLTDASAALIAILMYLAIPATIGTVASFIHWMSGTYGVQPSFNRCLTFTIYTASPLLLGSVIGLTPSLWLVTFAILAMIACSTRLLFIGLPIMMGIPQERGVVFACSILCVALVVLVTAKVITVTLWKLGIGPVYI